MNNWFTVKVKYIKELEDGSLKKVSEPYLLDSVSFTEAEARAYEEIGSFVRGEFLISGIAKTDFADIYHYEDADKWYKSKVQIINVDADTGKEKRSAQNYLVTANGVSQAIDRLMESLDGLMATFEIVAVQLTPLVDVIPFEGEREVIEEDPYQEEGEFDDETASQSEEEETTSSEDTEVIDEYEGETE